MNAPDLMLAAMDTVKTVAIDVADTGPTAIHSTTAGKRFVVFHLWLQTETAGTSVILSSYDSSTDTNLTGDINLDGTTANVPYEWKNGGFPILRGRAVSDTLRIKLSAANQVNGWMVVGEVDK